MSVMWAPVDSGSKLGTVGTLFVILDFVASVCSRCREIPRVFLSTPGPLHAWGSVHDGPIFILVLFRFTKRSGCLRKVVGSIWYFTNARKLAIQAALAPLLLSCPAATRVRQDMHGEMHPDRPFGAWPGRVNCA